MEKRAHEHRVLVA